MEVLDERVEQVLRVLITLVERNRPLERDVRCALEVLLQFFICNVPVFIYAGFRVNARKVPVLSEVADDFEKRSAKRDMQLRGLSRDPMPICPVVRHLAILQLRLRAEQVAKPPLGVRGGCR